MMATKRNYRALLWKAWLESKMRFWILLSGLVLLVAYVIFTGSAFLRGYAIQHPKDPLTYTEYVWQALFNYYFQGLWIVSVLILGLGGLLREKGQGFSNYTLSLPLFRTQLLKTRFYLGIAESIALGVCPICLIPIFSRLIGQSYPWIQALGFGFLLVASGILFHGFSFLLSAIFGGEFAAFLVGLFLSSTAFFAFKAKAIHKWSVFDIMNGAHSVDPYSHLLTRQLPWSGIVICILVTLSLFMISVLVTKRWNF
jgi:ABC-2 type transport system permease protein